MLKGLLLLVVMQAVGALLQAVWLPMLPAPVIGLLLLLALLVLLGRIPEWLEQASAALLGYLPLMLAIPATGILFGGDVLLAQLPAIGAGLVVSLLLCIPLCGVLMQRLMTGSREDD
ncbi:MAG: CidA/LrgA family protein [Pseudomonadales bacterium]|jgi:holin-like protein|uniref:CidA/LrgA family protein n=1 Tax=Halopseudomonas sp. TaxID=2901191 RepID=UPI000C558E56|nr:CidA/LrgA family protein [Pseudomonadales bacterium]MCK5532060.1 CidA/LrgA family protein [Halopseudomonas aestusnigri]|tara:strand:+ start:4162 stop:4512 length:351 start_codon:yes stop_codon:yes gene_type:complete